MPAAKTDILRQIVEDPYRPMSHREKAVDALGAMSRRGNPRAFQSLDRIAKNPYLADHLRSIASDYLF